MSEPLNDIPELDGWEAYCQTCGRFRTFDKRDEVDASYGSPYSEYVCGRCYSILMTVQKVGSPSHSSGHKVQAIR